MIANIPDEDVDERMMKFPVNRSRFRSQPNEG